ncbi:hypothetical protein A946_11225 [Methylacidiphilum kamchatkense Kam1]|uniref:Uncharacterized protein n=1 Tax=Methylacidiphilum kamchatkense Kam1 TaxID=1202785 RepID=A0ABR4ZU60_9BACT|nr:hypothetical protein [Methylacidiphilum kamchatkense]KIE57795.1 hypothetical protein A946_11225 [Methylacidiphilum kamchatkense Kam1]
MVLPVKSAHQVSDPRAKESGGPPAPDRFPSRPAECVPPADRRHSRSLTIAKRACSLLGTNQPMGHKKKSLLCKGKKLLLLTGCFQKLKAE